MADGIIPLDGSATTTCGGQGMQAECRSHIPGSGRGEEVSRRDLEDFGEHEHEGVGGTGAAGLEVGDNVAGDVGVAEVESGDQLLLSPTPRMAESDDGGADDIGGSTGSNAAGRQLRRHGGEVGVG